VLARIRAISPALSSTATRIANTVLTNPAGVLELTVSDLAEHSNTSVGSVVRFCQELGLRGYQDLKLRLAAEITPTPAQPAPVPDSMNAAATNRLTATADGFRQAIDTLDLTDLEPIVHTLCNATRILVVGIGTSSPIAQDTSYRLRSCGLPVDAPTDTHVQHVAARLLTEHTACLAISHTGQTRETLNTVSAARDVGATILSVTSYFRSPLVDLSHHAIVAGAAETRTHLEANTSRLLHLAVVDAITAAIAHTRPLRTRDAQNLYTETITEHRL
jgi:DNA-binding MurR/RpiR family transcriptional regulator